MALGTAAHLGQVNISNFLVLKIGIKQDGTGNVFCPSGSNKIYDKGCHHLLQKQKGFSASCIYFILQFGTMHQKVIIVNEQIVCLTLQVCGMPRIEIWNWWRERLSFLGEHQTQSASQHRPGCKPRCPFGSNQWWPWFPWLHNPIKWKVSWRAVRRNCRVLLVTFPKLSASSNSSSAKSIYCGLVHETKWMTHCVTRVLSFVFKCQLGTINCRCMINGTSRFPTPALFIVASWLSLLCSDNTKLVLSVDRKKSCYFLFFSVLYSLVAFLYYPDQSLFSSF